MTIMTKTLDIINACLQAIGEDPVTDSTSSHPSAITARAHIARESRRIQARGWWFNHETKIKLLPNENGEIVIPSNTLKVDPSNPNIPYVQRGSRLYDPVQHTFNINAPVVCNLVLELDIEDLPETAFAYILAYSVRKFYVGDNGDPQKARDLKMDENEAWVYMKQEDLAASDVNSDTREVHQLLYARLQEPGSVNGRMHSYNPTVPGG